MSTSDNQCLDELRHLSSPLVGQLLYPGREPEVRFGIVYSYLTDGCLDQSVPECRVVRFETKNLLTEKTSYNLLRFFLQLRDTAFSSITFNSNNVPEYALNPILATQLAISYNDQRQYRLHCTTANFADPSHLTAIGRLLHCSDVHAHKLEEHNLYEALRFIVNSRNSCRKFEATAVSYRQEPASMIDSIIDVTTSVDLPLLL